MGLTFPSTTQPHPSLPLSFPLASNTSSAHNPSPKKQRVLLLPLHHLGAASSGSKDLRIERKSDIGGWVVSATRTVLCWATLTPQIMSMAALFSKYIYKKKGVRISQI